MISAQVHTGNRQSVLEKIMRLQLEELFLHPIFI